MTYNKHSYKYNHKSCPCIASQHSTYRVGKTWNKLDYYQHQSSAQGHRAREEGSRPKHS